MKKMEKNVYIFINISKNRKTGSFKGSSFSQKVGKRAENNFFLNFSS
jgi:hypothetical protein